MVTASAGMDILCHALESYTARWFGDFDAKRPEQRVPYCGANPIADMWAEKSLSLLAGAFRRAVHDGSDRDARDQMALAATFAGLGFGNAGVHVPHACAYPVAGRVRDYRPEGYPADEPIVPHGMAVVMTAPAALALIFDASPERHRRAAELLGGGALPTGGADVLPEVLRGLMRDVGLPSGLACAVGELVGVHDTHFAGTAPSGRIEDYHGVHLLYRATVTDGDPAVAEQDGTTDAVAWVPVPAIESGEVRVLDVVRHALGL